MTAEPRPPDPGPSSGRIGTRWDRFWFTPVPAARLEVFRRALYAFVWIDVLLTASFVRDHASVDGDLYAPLLIGRVLPLPVPTDLVVLVTMALVLGGAALALAGRSTRLAGAVTALAYLEWMVIAFSYGKVDHDRFPLLVALFVVVSVRGTRLDDRTSSAAAGWALRMIQVAAVSVYFLSAIAKVRYGGWLWANSATLTQALVRRGTAAGRSLLDHPDVLVVAQWAAMVFEVSAVAMLVRSRIRWAWWATAVVFHVVTFALLSIAFFPQLVCLLAFLPLERCTDGPSDRARGRAALPQRVPSGEEPASAG